MKYNFNDYLKDKYNKDSMIGVVVEILKNVSTRIGLALILFIIYIGVLLISTVVGSLLNNISVINHIGLDNMALGLFLFAIIIALFLLYSHIRTTYYEYKTSKINKEIEQLKDECIKLRDSDETTQKIKDFNNSINKGE